MSEPITATIKNLIRSRVITWLGKGPAWADKDQEITVAYEPWSCADDNQRVCLLAELSNHEVELTLHVLTDDGVSDIRYNPASAYGAETVNAPAQEQPAVTTTAAATSGTSADTDHIVVTGTGSEISGMFKVTTVTPPKSTVTAPSGDGFTATSAGVPGVTAAPAEKTASTEESKEAGIAAVREKFNGLCAARKWADALQLLIDTYGSDKVTFTTRTVMAAKDFDAIVRKYNLA